jgi:hypothetical protein
VTEFNLEAAAHVVQLALTPVFLLSGVATLLGAFSARLSRVADHVDALSKEAPGPGTGELLAVLRLRSPVLDVAVVLSALAGALTCVAVLLLFLGQMRGDGAARMLFLSSGGAFVTEMLLTGRGVRRTADRQSDRVLTERCHDTRI